MSGDNDNSFVALLRPVSLSKPSTKTFKSKDYEIFVIESHKPAEKAGLVPKILNVLIFYF